MTSSLVDHANGWAASVAPRHHLVAYEIPDDARLFGGDGYFEAEIRFRLDDDVADADASATAQRAVARMSTTDPTDCKPDGTRVVRVAASTGTVGGRPGVVARLDIEQRSR